MTVVDSTYKIRHITYAGAPAYPDDKFAAAPRGCHGLHGVAPTNNHAERMIRFGVLWRKCSQGTNSEKGNRWVERILTLRQTCRLRSLKTYPILVDAIQRHLKGQQQDLSWLAHP